MTGRMRCWAAGRAAFLAVCSTPGVWATAVEQGNGAASAADSYYKTPPLFSTAPSPSASVQTVARFGPVGIGIELHQPAFVMKVKNVEKGSPAEATGKLKAGQIIETINGAKLHDVDPRIQLGDVITAAEATDGRVCLSVRDAPGAAAQDVVVQIPILGAYSPTWPLNCPKSEKIVRGFADYLARPGSDPGFSNLGMLFLLSTGDERDLEPVRQWIHGLAGKPTPTFAWHLGYGGIPLCEYYLRTGDDAALPVIQKWVDSATRAEYLDGWNGRGGVAAVTYGGGGGHLNAGGTHCLTFILLAKECGAQVNEDMLRRTLAHYYRFAGRGNNPYGDNRPEGSFVDNGKNGLVSMAMAAAASLTPDGEASVYAEARDVAAMTGFYTTTFMLHGHTGGGIGEIWRSAAMGLLADKKAPQYRDFMDGRRWHYELSRRFDGSFGILGGDRYDDTSWGAGYALTYTIPRKTLRIAGARPTKWVHNYRLPERPWGVKADDLFLSLKPASDVCDVSRETLAHDSAMPVIRRANAAGEVSDDELRRLVHHPDSHVRQLAANHAMGILFDYMWLKPGSRVRLALIREWAKSPDPRVRRAALLAVGRFLPAGEEGEAAPPMPQDLFDLAVGMLADPDESWWVKDAALAVVGRGTADMVAPHVAVLLPYLRHPEWWLQNGALVALRPVAGDERCYRDVLPAVAEFLRTCQRYNATGPMRGICEQLAVAPPAVQALALESLQGAFSGFSGVKTWAGGQDVTTTFDSQLEYLGKSMVTMPGGYDALFAAAKKRFPKDSLPYDAIFLGADPAKLGPDLRAAMQPIIRDRLIYEFMGENRAKLLAAAAATLQDGYVAGPGPLGGLVELYQKIGVHDYDWRVAGPGMAQTEWDYLTFDPPETQAYDLSPWRYRTVTLPAGLESWFKPEFDPAKAGWRKGQAPFGQYNGKLVTDMAEMAKLKCRCEMPMRTLWDKEVLLMRATLSLPALKEGHLYRLRIGDSMNVGCGDGYRIYVNGRLLIEQKAGIGRREGGRPRGAFITQAFRDEFGKGPVTLAATSFLRYGEKAIVTMPPVPQGTFNLWLEEMKLPPLDEATFRKAATMVPMLSAEWQARQDPDNAEIVPEAGRFEYDGRFEPDARLLGDWTAVSVVSNQAAFVPGPRSDPRGAPFRQLSFKEGGATDAAMLIWSGDRLLDLNRNQALRIAFKTLGGTDYLFIEAGGFSAKNPVGWTSPLVVMKRKPAAK